MFLLALALFNRHRRGCVKNAKGHNTSLQDRVASLATCSILRNTRIFSITIIVRSQQTQAITVNTEYDDDDPLERDCGIDLTQGAPHHFVPGFSYLLQGRSSSGPGGVPRCACLFAVSTRIPRGYTDKTPKSEES